MLRAFAASVLALAAQLFPTTHPRTVDEVTFMDIPVSQVELFEWALALYDDADLDLPPIDVVGHRTAAPCLGRSGSHRFEAGRSRIDLLAGYGVLTAEPLHGHTRLPGRRPVTGARIVAKLRRQIITSSRRTASGPDASIEPAPRQ